MRVFRRDVPDALETVIRRALSKEPDRRFQDAREMLSALVPFGADPPAESQPEPTDTLTIDLRDLREREHAERARRGSVPPPPAGSQDDLNGQVLVHLRDFLGAKVGQEGMAQVLAAVPPEVHARWVANVTDRGWFPSNLLDVVETADRLYGAGDRHMVLEAGAHLADAAFNSGVATDAKTPELLLRAAPSIWKRFFARGSVSVPKLGAGYGLLEISDHPSPSVARAVVAVGFLQRALELAGAREVDVRLARVAALGDGKDTVEATWS